MADFSFLSSTPQTPSPPSTPSTPQTIFSSTYKTSSLEFEEAYISLTHLKNNPQDFINENENRTMIELVMEFWSSPFTKHHTFIIRRVGSYLLDYQKSLSHLKEEEEEVGKEVVGEKEEELENVFEFIYTNLSGKECSILSEILHHFPHFYKNLLSSSSHNPIHNPNQNHKNEVLLRIMKKLQNIIQVLSKSPKFQSFHQQIVNLYKEIYTNTPFDLHPLYTQIFFTTIDSLTTTTHSSMIGDWHMSVEGEEEVENTVEFGYLLLIKGLVYIDRDRGLVYLNTFLSRFKISDSITSTTTTTTDNTTCITTNYTTSNSDHFEWLHNGQWKRLKEIDQILLINIYLHYTSYPLPLPIHSNLFEQLLKQIINVNGRSSFRVYECLLLAVPFIIGNIQSISISSDNSDSSESSEWRSQILEWMFEICSSKKEVFMYLYLESLCFMKILIIINTNHQSLKTSDLNPLLNRIMKLLRHPEFKYRITSEFFSYYADMIMIPIFISGSGSGYSLVFEEMNVLMVEHLEYFLLHKGRRRQMDDDIFYKGVIECIFSLLQYQQQQHTQQQNTQHTNHNEQQHEQSVLSLLLKEYTNNENIQYLQHLLQTTAHKLKQSPVIHSLFEPFLPHLLTTFIQHPQYPIRLSTISLLPFLTQNQNHQNHHHHQTTYLEVILELWFDKIYIVRESVLTYLLKNGYTTDLLSRLKSRCDSVGSQKMRYFGMFERMLKEGFIIEEPEKEEEELKEE